MRRNVRFKNFDLCLGSGYMCLDIATAFIPKIMLILNVHYYDSVVYSTTVRKAAEL